MTNEQIKEELTKIVHKHRERLLTAQEKIPFSDYHFNEPVYAVPTTHVEYNFTELTEALKEFIDELFEE